jgi:small subunit ribosomal protein S20
MPILHASFKDIKKTEKRTLRNQSAKALLKTETKKFIELLAAKKFNEAKAELQILISRIDKDCAKGIIHKNTASRKKSRLMKKLQKISA